MSITKEDIINTISKMNILEIIELTKLMEKTFDISTTQLQTSIVSEDNEIEKKEDAEKKLFSVIINNYGKSKINAIKVVREITNLGLKEAKDFVEALPKTIKENLSKEEAEKIKEKIDEAGAVAELK